MEGEIYVGIDPFFYFEHLCRIAGMPPLTYSWLVQEMMRTRHLGSKREIRKEEHAGGAMAQRILCAGQGDYVRDDEAMAHYILGCYQMSGPSRP